MDLLPIVIFTICLAIPSTSMETNIYTKTIQLQRGGKLVHIHKCIEKLSFLFVSDKLSRYSVQLVLTIILHTIDTSIQL